MALLVVAALAGASNAALAQKPKGRAAETNSAALRLLDKWDGALRSADDALADGDAKRARKQAGRVLHDCLSWALSGEPVERRLAMAFLLRAIADHRLGDFEDARWSWQSALILLPAVAEWDLTGYGTGGEELVSIESNPGWDLSEAMWPEQMPEGLRPPLKKRGSMAKIRPARVVTREGELRLQYLVTRSGRISGPKVVSNSLPSTYLAAMLEAYRDWRYLPGFMDGEVLEMLAVQIVKVKW